VSELQAAVQRFPFVDAIIVHRDLPGASLPYAIQQLKEKFPKTPLILLVPTTTQAKVADHCVNWHDPQQLVELLQQVLGTVRGGEQKAS
jgi:hypothetical protein